MSALQKAACIRGDLIEAEGRVVQPRRLDTQQMGSVALGTRQKE